MYARLKPKPAPGDDDPLTAHREAARAAQSEIDELTEFAAGVSAAQLAHGERLAEIAAIGKLTDRWSASAREYDTQRRTLRGWVESLGLSGYRVEHPELFALKSPGRIDDATHAVAETYRAINRTLTSKRGRLAFALQEHARTYWREVAEAISENFPGDLLLHVGMWAIAQSRAGGLDNQFDLSDLPAQLGATVALDEEFGLTQLEEVMQ